MKDFKRTLAFFRIGKTIKKSPVHKPQVQKSFSGKRNESLYIPICHFSPVPTEIISDDTDLRRTEYLNELSDLSGGSEGNELESLGNISHEMHRKFTFGIVEDDLDPIEEEI